MEFSDSIGRMVIDAVPCEMKQDVRCKPLTASAWRSGQGYKINTIGNGADYLIITHDDFYNQIAPLAEWKEKKGYRVKITKLSEINAVAAPSSTDIRNYIINAYNTWNPQPLYLLLVGDSQFLASNITTSVYWGDIINPTDLYYAAIDGADYFPDLFMGRLPCATTAECRTMVDKILLMEQDPPVTNSFYKNALAVGFFEDDNHDGTEDLPFIETCEAIKDFFEFDDWHVTTSYLAGSSVTPRRYFAGSIFHTDGAPYIDSLAFFYPGDTTATNIIADAVNDGACIVYYMGHGSRTAWGPPHKLSPVLQYAGENVQNLTNGDKLSWVISIACLTASFDESGDCFGETWLKKQGGGAYAFIGSTGLAQGPDSAYLQLGFYECLYPNFIETLSTFPGYKSGTPYPGNAAGEGAHFGQILNFGKMFMFDRYATGYTKNQFEKFHLFGCPEQEPRLVSPRTLNVTYPAILTTKLANFDITVTQLGRPVKGARVCLLLKPADFYAGITDDYGKAHFEFEPNKAGEIQLTVTHKEALSFQGIIVSTVSDVTPPTGTIKINNDAQYAVSTSVTLSLSAADTGSGVAQMRFSNDNVTWSVYEAYSASKSWTLTSGNGTKMVYVKFKDVMGNESSPASDTIISLAAVETPWKSNENGVLSSNHNLDNAHTMGYKFKPIKDGWIIRLGGYFKGTNVVYLWDSSEKLLSSAAVTSNHNWSYSDITPVEVKANQTYTAAVYIKDGASFRLCVAALPRTYGNVIIENGFYKLGGGYPSNPSTFSTTMCGLVDVGYSYIPVSDTTPPVGSPVVTDSGAYTTNKSELTFSWTKPCVDNESGIVEYQYAVGTSKGATDVFNWISLGMSGSSAACCFALTNGTTYYFSVRAKNGAGLYSAAGNSDGIKVDTTIPVITHTPIASASKNKDIAFTAAVTDNISGVKETTLYWRKWIRRMFWWEWSELRSLPMTSQGNDKYSATLTASQVEDKKINYYIKAADKAGNTGSTPEYAISRY